MKRTAFFTGILFFGISITIFVEGLRVKRHLGFTDYQTPLRPDTYLLIVASLIAFFSMLYILKEGFLKVKYDVYKRSGLGIRNAALTLGLFIGYILLMKSMGYALSTFVFYFIFFRAVGRYSYLKTFLFSAITTICSYVIFVELANMILPKGIVENLF